MIILFRTEHCPICHMLQGLLDANHITYEVREDLSEIQYRGFTHVPVLKVGGNYLNPKEAMAWVNAQAENGKAIK